MAHTLVDCDCVARVHADGSGAELDFCPLHEAAPNLLFFVVRITEWLESVANKAASQERDNRGRFNSIADACAADARNYRAMAKDGRAAIAKAEGR